MIPREYRIPLVLIALGSALWITSLYQLEIVYIWLAIGKDTFEMPFYLWTMSLPVARDFWYLVNGISLLLASVGGAVFNGRRMAKLARATALGVKLGKKPVRLDKRTIRLKTILKDLPPIPDYYTVDGNIPCDVPIPMLANDRWGDCVIAARAHQTLRFEAKEQGCAIAITDDEVLKEYWEQGCPIAPWTKPDRGLVMLNALNDWRKSGWVVDGNIYTSYAFASTDTNEEVKQAIVHLGGVNAGIQVTQLCMDQFNQGRTWDVNGGTSQVIGGHAIYIYAYDKDGLWCITWGKRQKMTWAFFDRYCDEAYAIVDNRNAWMENSPIDVDKLNDLLEVITK